jgi:hypothetical protein
MNKIKRGFLIGFKEGWSLFFSPFVGFYRSVSALWATRSRGIHKHNAQ